MSGNKISGAHSKFCESDSLSLSLSLSLTVLTQGAEGLSLTVLTQGAEGPREVHKDVQQ